MELLNDLRLLNDDKKPIEKEKKNQHLEFGNYEDFSI